MKEEFLKSFAINLTALFFLFHYSKYGISKNKIFFRSLLLGLIINIIDTIIFTYTKFGFNQEYLGGITGISLAKTLFITVICHAIVRRFYVSKFME